MTINVIVIDDKNLKKNRNDLIFLNQKIIPIILLTFLDFFNLSFRTIFYENCSVYI